MRAPVYFAFALAVAAATAAPVAARQSAAPAASTAPAPAAPGMPAVTHLVYRFGYNTPATDSGTGTGTTTIDITGVAPDGGLTISATDDWWNTVNPRQTSTCEVYANGGVSCPDRPYSMSPIQLAIVPLLGRSYFTPLASSPTATWTQTYDVKAVFFPASTRGFGGQLYTWNASCSLTGKGVAPDAAPLVSIHSDGTLTQQGGRAVTAKHKANILYDPRIQMPVYVDELITFIPRITVNDYTIQMKLIQT